MVIELQEVTSKWLHDYLHTLMFLTMDRQNLVLAMTMDILLT